jgi:hypothetical protein
MSLKNVSPGKYAAKVKDWGVEEVEKLGGAIKAVVVFEFETETSVETIKWDGFIQKRDGDINKKTVDTLDLCGLDGDLSELLEGGSGLDTEKELEITVIQEGDYLRVEWVNEPGGSQYIKKAAGGNIAKKLKGLSLQAGLKSKKSASRPPNMAPGAEPIFDAEEEIPF